MPASLPPERQIEVNSFLSGPHLARLATVDPDTMMPHVVPVWYLWDGASLWINSYQSTLKIRQLERNPNCAVVIDTDRPDSSLRGVLFKGQAEVLEGPPEMLHTRIAEIYVRYLGSQGVLEPDPQEWIHSPEARLVRLTPQTMITF